MENFMKPVRSRLNRSPNRTASPIPTIKTRINKAKEREEREKIVLWRSPVKTLKFCALECGTLFKIYTEKLVQQRLIVTGFLVFVAITCVLYAIPGRHQPLIGMICTNSRFVLYWVGLGVLSSVGLGTGLHTFLLYLGPHIASVTLAAYNCNSLDFPEPPYPDEIICPEVSHTNFPPNLWDILAKVRLEAFLWGAGTALGELPPYFMARAARLSGYDSDEDEDLQKFEELKNKNDRSDLSMLDQIIQNVVKKVGFLGILACASVPNPLFDLAGITCGHFLVPFGTFFGATFFGKAVIKMHIQTIFVITVFNESLIEKVFDLLNHIPILGKRLQEPLKTFLAKQKKKLHDRNNVAASDESGNLLAEIFEKVVLVMMCYFIVSIINSLAQSHHRRIHKSPKG